jgi:hypothetical protein
VRFFFRCSSLLSVNHHSSPPVQILELRLALQEAHFAAGVMPLPTYTDTTLTVGVTGIRLVHIQELRDALIPLE